MTINTAQEGKQTATSSGCLRFMDRLTELRTRGDWVWEWVMFVQIWRNKAQCMQPRKYFLVIARRPLGFSSLTVLLNWLYIYGSLASYPSAIMFYKSLVSECLMKLQLVFLVSSKTEIFYSLSVTKICFSTFKQT